MLVTCGVHDMRRISKKVLASYPRPLQGGMRVLGSGSRPTLGSAYQQAMDKANAANEARYNAILAGYDDLSKRVGDNLAGVGDQEYRDIDRTYKSMGSDVYQRLVNRGFANSTLPATGQMGVERERSAARSRLASDLAQQRANYDMRIAEGRMGVMERRNDIAPDPAQMMNLAQSMGQGGYGTGMQQVGPTIGISPQQYQMAYQQALAQHMGMMPGGMMMGGGVGHSPAQQERMARAKAWWAMKRAARPTGVNPNIKARNLARPKGVSKSKQMALPSMTISSMGYRPTVPGPWSSGYGVGTFSYPIDAAGPARGRYMTGARNTGLGSYRSDLPYPYGPVKPIGAFNQGLIDEANFYNSLSGGA